MAAVTPETFYTILSEFMVNLTEIFPANEGAKTASAMLDMFKTMPATHAEIVLSWYDCSAPIAWDIKNKNAEVVAEALDNNSNALIRNIGARSILTNPEVDQETKDNVWQYLATLTAMAHNLKPTLSRPESAVKPASPPQKAQPAATPKPQAAAKPNPADVIKGITQAMPEIFKSLNDMLKADDGENPMAQLLKQVMNPNGLNTGLAPNVAANMMDRDPGPLMGQVAAETGLTPDEIMHKLKRLELYEKARAKKRSGKKK